MREDRRWWSLTALFSGMRPSEIERLERDDIVQLIGRPHFHIHRHSRHGNSKSTKTDSSIRKSPVHPELIREAKDDAGRLLLVQGAR
jgi:integrase